MATPAARKVKLRHATADDADFLGRLSAEDDVARRIGRLSVNPGGSDIRIIETGEGPVGVVGIVRSEAFEGRDVELICAVVHARRGQRIAKEACMMLVRGYATPAGARLLACVARENEAGLRLAERVGFEKLGISRPSSDDMIWVLRRP